MLESVRRPEHWNIPRYEPSYVGKGLFNDIQKLSMGHRYVIEYEFCNPISRFYPY